MPKGEAVEFPLPEKKAELICPFMSMPVLIGTKNGGLALAPVAVPVYDLMRVSCVKELCRLWIGGKNTGAFVGTIAPGDVHGCCFLEGRGLA